VFLRTLGKRLETEAPYIARILPFVTEYPVKNLFVMDDIFHDLSIQVFEESALEKASKDPTFWTNNSEPTTDPTDPEVITGNVQ